MQGQWAGAAPASFPPPGYARQFAGLRHPVYTLLALLHLRRICQITCYLGTMLSWAIYTQSLLPTVVTFLAGPLQG